MRIKNSCVALALALLPLIFATGCCLNPWQPHCCEKDVAADAELPNTFEIINSSQATAIIQDFAVEMDHKHSLKLQKAKTYYDGGIHAIQMEFISQDLMEMCEARKLIVDMTEGLLAALNQDPLLAKDIANYPFRPNNLELYITFQSYFGKYVDPYYIHWICMEDGEVDYYLFDLKDNLKNKWHARHETYATSREIVVYEREAERKYQEVHHPKINVFGKQRYFPNDNQP